MRKFAASLAGAVLLTGVTPTAGHACGYENPAAVATGALNLSFPDALHVGTAVWQAQVDGLLPRTDASAQAGSAMAQQAALWDVMRLLDRLRAQLEAANDSAQSASPHPTLATVFLSSVLWTRFASSEGRVAAQMHASGPDTDDVVIVTEPLVLRALVERRLDATVAIERGLMRLYGESSQVAAARRWLIHMGAT